MVSHAVDTSGRQPLSVGKEEANFVRELALRGERGRRRSKQTGYMFFRDGNSTSGGLSYLSALSISEKFVQTWRREAKAKKVGSQQGGSGFLISFQDLVGKVALFLVGQGSRLCGVVPQHPIYPKGPVDCAPRIG